MRSNSMKWVTTILLVFTMVVNICNVPVYAVDDVNKDYCDVQTHWSKDAVLRLVSEGVVSGSKENGISVIRPNSNITRAEFLKVVLLSKYSETEIDKLIVDSGSQKSFTDVEGHWAEGLIRVAKAKGIVNGYENGDFQPNAFVSRGEAVKIIITSEEKLNNESIYTKESFSDVSIDYWEFKYVEIAKESNLVTGYKSGEFISAALMTRGEAFTVVDRLIDYISKLTYEENLSKIVVMPTKDEIKPGDAVKFIIRGNNQEELLVGVRRTSGLYYSLNIMSGDDLLVNIDNGIYEVLLVTDSSIEDNIYGEIVPIYNKKVITDSKIRLFNNTDLVVIIETLADDSIPAARPGSSTGGSTSGGTVIPPIPVAPVLTLTDTDEYMNFAVTETQSTSTYSFVVTLNGTEVLNDDIADISQILTYFNPSFGTYVFKIHANDSSGKTFESNAINYFIASGLTFEISSDDDYDGLSNEIEAIIGTNPLIADTDEDNMPDGYEYLILFSSPILKDTFGTGITDDENDFDMDGLKNIEEMTLGTNPVNNDTDGDGLLDSEELAIYKTNPLEQDTDFDGINDYDEVILGINPLSNDSDGDGVLDMDEEIEQEVSFNNIAEALFVDNNAVPSIKVLAKGNINKTFIMREGDSILLGDSRAVIGKPVEVVQYGAESATLQFKIRDGLKSTITVHGEAKNKLFIVYYDDLKKTHYLDTTYDATDHSISAPIDGLGLYFVLDAEIYMSELGLSLRELLESGMTPVSPDSEKIEEPVIELVENDYASMDNGTVEEVQHVVDIVEIDKVELASVVGPDDTIKPVTYGQADIVFIIDTTGSMGDEISNVKNNIINFVTKLKDKGIAPNFALVDYRDIDEDGLDTTKVHLNGVSNWFIDSEDYKTVIANLPYGGGGDYPESAIDALEMSRTLDIRDSASKFFVLITDATYKTNNRYGITDLNEETSLLVKDDITTYVVGPMELEPEYRQLYTDTNGAYLNIYGDFSIELSEIADEISEVVIDDGEWIFLSGPTNHIVKLGSKLDASSDYDTDEDGISDVDELGSLEYTIVNIRDVLNDMFDTGYTSDLGEIKKYSYKSNPTDKDSDDDSYEDNEDLEPLDKFVIPTILLHGRSDNSDNVYGAQTKVIGTGHLDLKRIGFDKKGLNSHYIMDNINADGSIDRDATKTKEYSYKSGYYEPLKYYDGNTHQILELIPSTSLKSTPENLAYEMTQDKELGYKENETLFILNYPNFEFTWKNSDLLKWYIEEYLAEMDNLYPTYDALSKKGTSEDIFKVNLVGHSNGGLVSRYYIENLDGSKHVNKLVTLNTPHWGSGLAIASTPSKAMDVDLRPYSMQFDGSKISMVYLSYKRHKYINEHQTPQLNADDHGDTKYYFVGGYDDMAPYLLPNDIKDKTLVFDFAPKFSSFNNFRTSVADGFYVAYPSHKDDIIFTFTDSGGDNVVNCQSQYGITYKDFSTDKHIEAERYTMLIDTIFGHNSANHYHGEMPHRGEAVDTVIENLQY